MYHLTNRQWDKAGFGWYDPRRKLLEYKHIVKAEYMNTTSSAGDWSGLAVAEYKGKFYVIPFWQENRYPYVGYKLSTAKYIARLDTMPSNDELGYMYDDFVY